VSKKILGSAVLILAILFLLFPRVLKLDAFRSPDEKRWVANTAGFTRNLSMGKWDKLLQQPHPGITTQWLGSLAIRFNSWQAKKLPIVAGQVILIVFIAYVFSKLWGRKSGLLVLIFLAVDPFLFAHSRVYAMDSLLALFSVLSVSLLLLWDRTGKERYLFFSAFCASAAFLSKISGVIIIPLSIFFIFWKLYIDKENYKIIIRKVIAWILYCVISSIMILPSVAIAPTKVIGDFKEFLTSDQYAEEHSLGVLYYLRTLEFFSSPAHFLLIVSLPLIIFFRKISIDKDKIKDIVWLFFLAVLFFLEMMIGAKKGDRYILPVFVLLDTLSALVVFVFWTNYLKNKSKLLIFLVTLFLILCIWQEQLIIKLFPHNLAYVNPITKKYFGDKRSGWGEGLDLAADYLNQKANAKDLKVASYYPNEFAENFSGETVSMNQFDNDSVDYVIVYRAMYERGNSYETDVLNKYKNKTPEKVISFNGIKFVWVYKK